MLTLSFSLPTTQTEWGVHSATAPAEVAERLALTAAVAHSADGHAHQLLPVLPKIRRRINESSDGGIDGDALRSPNVSTVAAAQYSCTSLAITLLFVNFSGRQAERGRHSWGSTTTTSTTLGRW